MLAGLFAVLYARVIWSEGDGAILEWRGRYWDTCLHCYPEGRPEVGSLILFPLECPEVREVAPPEFTIDNLLTNGD